MDDKNEEVKTPFAPQVVVGPSVPPDGDPLIETDDLTWEHAVERSKKPVAVMFYSPSCALLSPDGTVFQELCRRIS